MSTYVPGIDELPALTQDSVEEWHRIEEQRRTKKSKYDKRWNARRKAKETRHEQHD